MKLNLCISAKNLYKYKFFIHFKLILLTKKFIRVRCSGIVHGDSRSIFSVTLGARDYML